jgi:phosphate transport system permease protein
MPGGTRIKIRLLSDLVVSKISFAVSLSTILLLLLIICGLSIKSLPILTEYSLADLLFSSDWKPLKGKFGFAPFIISTIYVTVLSSVIAIPVCLLVAIFLAEYCGKRLRNWIVPFIDILAGLPSVLFGIWGIIVIVPFIRDHLAPAFGYETTGYCLLTGGIVLAIMVFPIMIYVMYDVIRLVPIELREATLSLGATKWETIKLVVLRKAMPGIIAAIVLGVSRALGETIAVLMVVGNVVTTPGSLFSPAYPIPSLIANNYGEMMSVPRYEAALMFSALLLLLVIIVFNIGAQRMLTRIEKNNS